MDPNYNITGEVEMSTIWIKLPYDLQYMIAEEFSKIAMTTHPHSFCYYPFKDGKFHPEQDMQRYNQLIAIPGLFGQIMLKTIIVKGHWEINFIREWRETVEGWSRILPNSWQFITDFTIRTKRSRYAQFPTNLLDVVAILQDIQQLRNLQNFHIDIILDFGSREFIPDESGTTQLDVWTEEYSIIYKALENIRASSSALVHLSRLIDDTRLESFLEDHILGRHDRITNSEEQLVDSTIEYGPHEWDGTEMGKRVAFLRSVWPPGVVKEEQRP